MTFAWHTTPTTEEMEAAYALTQSLDPRFAREDRAFWESRTPDQLSVLRHGAFHACERETFAKANYYIAKPA